MSLQGVVDATAMALGGAREMFGPAAAAAGLPSTSGLLSLKTSLGVAVDSAPQVWRGVGGGGYRLSGGKGVAALDAVVGADGRVAPQVVAASGDSREGRSGMNTVVSDTRRGVDSIAPSTDTPAGKQVLVNHLEGQLDRAKTLLIRSEQRNIAMANMIRAAGDGYGGRGMGGMPMSAGMGMPSMGAGGIPSMSALGRIPAMMTKLGIRTGRGSSTDLGNALFETDPRGSAASRAVAYARSKIGSPYVWGAEGPNAFDCSGLTAAAYAHAGVSIPRTTYELINAGVPVTRSNIREGDLILCNWSAPRTPEHVMIAVSPTMAIEAPTPGQRVQLTTIPTGHIEVRRVA